MSAPCRIFSDSELELANLIAEREGLFAVQVKALIEQWAALPSHKEERFEEEDEDFKELLNYEKSNENGVKEVTPRQKYNQEFTVIEQEQVNETLGDIFLSVLEDIAYDLEQKYYDMIDDAQASGDVFKEAQASRDVAEIQNDETRIGKILSNTGLNNIVSRIHNEIVDRMNGSTFSNDAKAQYARLYQHLDAAMEQALPYLESKLSIRIKDLSASMQTVNELLAKQIEEKEENEAIQGAEETENGRDATKAFEGSISREDPRNTTSAVLKRMLAEITMVDSKGNTESNMFGTARHINPNTAYISLLNILSSMKNPDDFMVTDNEGKIKYPLLESRKNQARYPWLKNVVNKLKENEQLQNALYHDMQRTFTNYWIISGGKSMSVNDKDAERGVKLGIIENVDNGIILNKNLSIYEKDGSVTHDVTGILNPLHAKVREFNNKLGWLCKETKDDPEKFKTTDTKDLQAEAKELFASFGVNIDKYTLKSLFATPRDIEDFRQMIVTNMGNAVSNAKKYSKQRDKDGNLINNYYIDFANSLINEMCKQLAVVTDVNNEITFNQNGSSRPSFTAPCYMDKIINNLSNMTYAERVAFIEKEFKPYDWFYNKATDKYRLPILNDLVKKTDASVARNLKKITMLEIDGLEYEDWTPDMITKTLINMYNDPSCGTDYAYYGVPIYSDSPCLDLIKMKKYSKEDALDKLVDLGLQELTRIDIVEKREAKRMAYENWIRGNKQGVEPEKIYEIQNYDTKFHYDSETKNYVRDADFGASFQFLPYLNEILKDRKTDNGAVVEGLQSMIANGKLDEAKKRMKSLLEERISREVYDFIEDNAEPVSSMDFESTPYDSFFAAVSTRKAPDPMSDENKDKDYADVLREDLFEQLMPYYLNDMFARSTIIQLTVSDYAFFKNPVDFQKRYKQIYAAGQRLNTNSRLGKKTEFALYIQEEEAISNSIDEIRNVLKERGVSEENIKTVMEGFSQTEVANAQSWRTPRSYKSVIDMMGKLTPEMEASIDKLVDGTWTKADFETMLQVIKPFVFSRNSVNSQVGDSLIKVSNQHKNSESIMTSFIDNMIRGIQKTNPKLKALYDFMDAHGIDVAHNTEAIKCGGQGVINLKYVPAKFRKLKRDDKGNVIIKEGFTVSGKTYDDFYKGCKKLIVEGQVSAKEVMAVIDQTRPNYEEAMQILEEATRPNIQGISNVKTDNDSEFNSAVVHSIDYEDYMIAAPTPAHHMDCNAIFGSQLRNLIVTDLPDNISITVNGKTYKSKDEIVARYNELISANYLEAFAKVNKKFEDIEKLQKFLVSQIEGNPKYSRDMLNALQLVDEVDYDGNPTGRKRFNIPICSPAIKTKIEELMLAAWKKQVTVQKIHGAALIQSAAYGFDKNLKCKFDKDGKLEYMECYMPATSQAMIEKYWDENTRTLDFSKMDDSLKKAIGTRIPTEGKYSMAPLKIVGFLPQSMGSSIMLPTDITTLSGSDFDVDKMFIMLKELEEVFDKEKAYSDYEKEVRHSKEAEAAYENWRKEEDRAKVIKFEEKFNISTSSYDLWTEFYNDNPDAVKEIDETIERKRGSYTAKEFKQLHYRYGGKLNDFLPNAKERFDAWFKEKYPNVPNYSDWARELGDIKSFKDYKEEHGITSPTFKEWLNTFGNRDKYTDLKAINYSPELAASDQSRAQRNNELIDIMHAILTSKEASPDFFNPQSFGELKGYANQSLKLQQLSKILERDGYKGIEKATGVNLSFHLSAEAQNAAIQELFDKLPTLNIKGANQAINPVSARSFAYFHKQNMTGGKLIGVYANNTVTYAKCQGIKELGLTVKGLQYEGKEITTFTEVKDFNGKNISSNCAQFSAASVDNVKDPVLAKLFQDLGTAKYACAMLRLGFPIEEISLFFTAPQVRGAFYLDPVKGQMKLSKENRKYVTEFTEEVQKTGDMNVNIHLTKADFRKAALGLKSENFSRFCNFIFAFADELTSMTKAYKADSPNGAIGHTTGEVINQLWNVDRMRDFIWIKNASVVVNNEDTKDSINPLVTRVQSAYQNGIKKAWDSTSRYFIEGSKRFDKMVAYLRHIAANGYVSDATLNHLSRHIVNHKLAQTKFFNPLNREMYLREFPDMFIQFMVQHPEIANLNMFRKLKVVNGQVKLDNANREQPAYKEMLMQEMDSLLYSEDPQVVQFAKMLFRYSYYKDGLSFGPENFGNYFSSLYYSKFDEVANALNELVYELNGENAQDDTEILATFMLSNPDLIPMTGYRKFEDNTPSLFDKGITDNGLIIGTEHKTNLYGKSSDDTGDIVYYKNSSKYSTRQDIGGGTTTFFEHEVIHPAMDLKKTLSIKKLINVNPNVLDVNTYIVDDETYKGILKIQEKVEKIMKENEEAIEKGINRLCAVIESKYGPLLKYEGGKYTLNYTDEMIELDADDFYKASTNTRLDYIPMSVMYMDKKTIKAIDRAMNGAVEGSSLEAQWKDEDAPVARNSSDYEWWEKELGEGEQERMLSGESKIDDAPEVEGGMDSYLSGIESTMPAERTAPAFESFEANEKYAEQLNCKS